MLHPVFESLEWKLQLVITIRDVNLVSGVLLDSDTESTPEHGSLVVAPKQMSSALGSLLANYGSTSESDEEPEGEFIVFNNGGCYFCSFYVYTHLCILVAPIQRARKVIQENQTLLNGISPASGDSGASKRVENRSETRTVPKPSSGPNVWNDRKRGRGGRGRRYQDMPQSRRATLLEMVKSSATLRDATTNVLVAQIEILLWTTSLFFF